MVKKGIIGFAIGVVAGLFGVAAHAGFMGVTLLGFFFALVLVAAGGWFTIEWFGTAGWLTYLIALFTVTAFLLLLPHTSDIFVTPQKWVSQVYIVLAPIAVIIPALLVTWMDKK